MPTETLTIRPARSDADIDAARTLFRAYAASLDFALCFQGFDEELETLPGDYAPPGGVLLLAEVADEVAGCVAARKLDGDTCEMKRLYVRPAYRGAGVGRALAEAVIDRARHLGYARMRLDTVASMHAARALYASLGFEETAPYYDNPLPDVVYMERDLRTDETKNR